MFRKSSVTSVLLRRLMCSESIIARAQLVTSFEHARLAFLYRLKPGGYLSRVLLRVTLSVMPSCYWCWGQPNTEPWGLEVHRLSEVGQVCLALTMWAAVFVCRENSGWWFRGPLDARATRLVELELLVKFCVVNAFHGGLVLFIHYYVLHTLLPIRTAHQEVYRQLHCHLP